MLFKTQHKPPGIYEVRMLFPSIQSVPGYNDIKPLTNRTSTFSLDCLRETTSFGKKYQSFLVLNFQIGN